MADGSRKQKTPPKRGSKLVGERGFEPPTHWSQTSCATKLRYEGEHKRWNEHLPGIIAQDPGKLHLPQ